MTGGGRCQRRRKAMAGGGGRRTAETTTRNRNDSVNRSPDDEITEKPSSSSEITKIPPELDLFTQARKALSFRSPFDSEDSPGLASGPNSLPSGVSHLLSRHADSRKRHKKLHSESSNLSGAGPGRQQQNAGDSIWVETEEYFRELTLEDIERLDRVASIGVSCSDKAFLIPSLSGDGGPRDHCGMLGGGNLENGVELNGDEEVGVDGVVVEEESGPRSMDVDGGEAETEELDIRDKVNGEKRLSCEKESTSFNGVEWLLGSRSKVYLASERPSKKRKLLGRDAGLEKLLVARPIEELGSVCDFCCYGDMGDPLNCLIKCGSCRMVVHQRCYGVQDEVDSSWLCSWCKWKTVLGLTPETPCLLCPKKGGALKPVQKRGLGSEGDGSEVEFAHLFCCQWMPEVYLEDTRKMEPIMNMDEVKDTRRKMICYLCKVKCGACVRCSNGSCRTSFHPICAREARHRMEIWGKLGCDEVELRAFCSKHSEVQYEGGGRDAGDISLIAELDPGKLNDTVLDEDDVLDEKRNSESQKENGDALDPADKCSSDRNGKEDANTCGILNFTMILKKLIDLGKVNAKDLASEIGVSHDSLNTMLLDNHMVPELQCKLLRWLKKHAHIGGLQRNLKVKIKSLVTPNSGANASEDPSVVSIEESGISDAVPVKSVPPRRRTKSDLRIVKDGNSCSPEDQSNDETTDSEVDKSLLVAEDLCCLSKEPLTEVSEKIMIDPEQHQDNSANKFIRFQDELRALAQCLSEDGLGGETKQYQTAPSLVSANGKGDRASYVHPLIYSKLMQTENDLLGKSATHQSEGLANGGASASELSSSSDLCRSKSDLQAPSGDSNLICNGVNLDQLVRGKNLGMLKLSPADEVEGELIYYQQRLLSNAVVRKHISGDLISKVVRRLPQEMNDAGRRKWDAVLVSRYNHDLKEAKKQGRKERRHKEAQAVLAAATAAAAASSRISSIRKDAIEESEHQEDLLKRNVSDVRPGVHSHHNPRVRETISRSAVARSSFDKNSDSFQLASGFSKDHPRCCDVCRRSETVLNPILVCASCKVAVHLDCYRSVKSTTGPWHCELCEDLLSLRGSGTLTSNSWEKPYSVAECVLCGGTAGPFRKSVDGQWIHALCAEWVLESTYRRGQINPIEGMDAVSKGTDICTVCRRKQGVCLKCSYGHCQSTFHPTCARSAGFYMTVRTSGGKLQHKAYCEKHSVEQRAKADTQKHGIEEFKSLKQVRVELERLRLLCERIIKREKLKRELVVCSHNILASNRDAVLSALARHPFYQPEVSSESATTSIRGYTDSHKSGSEMVQRSDDITVDSTVSGKRRVKFPMSMDNDQKTDDSSTSQNLYTLKPVGRASLSGKQIPERLSITSRSLPDDVEKRSKYRKHPETFEKEIIMTSDQASMKNQRLPKGFVYVPVRCLSKDKETVADACSREPVERKG